MLEEKRTNSAVVVLICTLLVIIIIMGVWMIVDKFKNEPGAENNNEAKVENELTEKDKEQIAEEFAKKFKDICYEVSPEHAENFNFTDAEIKQLKQRVRQLYVETVKKIKQIDGEISDDYRDTIYLLSDQLTDNAIAYAKTNSQLENEANSAIKKATIANIKHYITLTYAEAISRGPNGVPINESGSIMTKEDYTRELKKKFTDEEIKLVDFTVDSNGVVKFDTNDR